MSEPIGSLRVELSANAAAFEKDMGRARKAVSDSVSRMDRSMAAFRASVDRSVKSLFSLRTAALAAAGVAGLFLLARRAIQTADEIAKAADKVGVAIEALQELRFAAGRAGVETEQLDTALKVLSRTIGQAAAGTGDAVDVFNQLGIALTDQEGNIRATQDILRDVADRFDAIESPATRAALAQKLFGRSGIEMLNMLKGGSAEMDRMAARARELGVVLGEDIVRRAEVAADELDDMEAALRVAGTSAALELMPAMRTLAHAMTDPDFLNALQQISQSIANLIIFFVKYSNVILPVVAGLAAMAATSRMGAKQYSILIGALTAGAAAWQMNKDGAQDLTKQIEEIRTASEQLTDADFVPDSGTSEEIEETTDALAALTQTLQIQNLEMDQLLGRYRDAPQTVSDLRNEIELENAARAANVDFSTDQGRAWASAFREGQKLRQLLADVERVTGQTTTATQTYNEELRLLNALLHGGYITQTQFNTAVADAKEALERTSDKVEETTKASDAMGDALGNAFDRAAIGGEKLSGVLEALLQDILRILSRPLVDQLGNLFSGFIGSILSPGASLRPMPSTIPTIITSAHGNVFDRGQVVPFRKGGIVNGPTLFPMRSGAGLMGEAGPEAVMPLKRIGGRLGVSAEGMGSNVEIHIHNNTDSKIRTEEQKTPRGKTIKMYIDDVTGQNLGNQNSETSRILRNTYGARPGLIPRG